MADDSAQSIIVFRRIADDGSEVICACNFTPVTRKQYRFGVPAAGSYKELLSSDDAAFGGSGVKNGTVRSKKLPAHGYDNSIEVTLPGLSTVYFSVPAKKERRICGAKSKVTVKSPVKKVFKTSNKGEK